MTTTSQTRYGGRSQSTLPWDASTGPADPDDGWAAPRPEPLLLPSRAPRQLQTGVPRVTGIERNNPSETALCQLGDTADPFPYLCRGRDMDGEHSEIE